MGISGRFGELGRWAKSAGQRTSISRFIRLPAFIEMPRHPGWWSMELMLRVVVASGLLVLAGMLSFYGDDNAVAFMQGQGYAYANAQAINDSLAWIRVVLIVAALIFVFAPLYLRPYALALVMLVVPLGAHVVDPDVGHGLIHDIDDWSMDLPNEREVKGVDPSFFDDPAFFDRFR